MIPYAAAVAALSLALNESGVVAASPSASPVISSWLGVTLGEASKDVRSQLGKPREIVASSVGDLWHYDIDNGNATLEVVISQDQVLNITARVKDGKQSSLADPVGGALGMTAQALRSARGVPLATYDNGASIAYGQAAGVRWFYAVDDGVVTGISVSNPLPSPAPAEVLSGSGRDGSRLERALVVKASKAIDATNAEMTFLRKLACSGGGSWRVTGQETVPAGGRYFDLLHVMCSTDFYFDVASSFGK